jgi:hypothetical protein
MAVPFEGGGGEGSDVPGGAGSCVLIAPEVFDQREDDGIVILLNAEPAPQHLSSSTVTFISAFPPR